MAVTNPHGHDGEDWVPTDDTFAARLYLVRSAMKWTNSTMAAKACGLNDESWRQWEGGSMPRDLQTVVNKIHAATNVSREWLAWGVRTGSFAPFAVFDGDGQPDPGQLVLAFPPALRSVR